MFRVIFLARPVDILNLLIRLRTYKTDGKYSRLGHALYSHYVYGFEIDIVESMAVMHLFSTWDLIFVSFIHPTMPQFTQLYE